MNEGFKRERERGSSGPSILAEDDASAVETVLGRFYCLFMYLWMDCGNGFSNQLENAFACWATLGKEL